MKTIKSFLFKSALAASVLALGMGAVSCNDMLDTKPQGQFTAGQIGDDEAIALMT